MSLRLAAHVSRRSSTSRAREGEKPGVGPLTLPVRDAPWSQPVLSTMLQDQPGKGTGIQVVRGERGVSE